MKKLLIFVDWFLPGYKAGGQIQSCANLASELKNEMDVHIVTTDRDMGDSQPYDSVLPDKWNILPNGLKVLYLSPANRGFKSIQSVIRSVEPDCIYLNSMFSFSFTLLPIEACRVDKTEVKIILAPRGMLHKGALQYKNLKKKIFFQAFKFRGFQKRITFHATDATEETDIKRIFGKKVTVELVKDFPATDQPNLEYQKKDPGTLSCLFVSRISPKKNLSYLLSVLQQVKSNVVLTIAGPIESAEYWSECKKIIDTLPSNIKSDYIGAIPNQQLAAIYQQHHLFFLPTFGENFGHVIFDSLLNGRPVLISDLTPWRNLKSNNTGWDLALSEQQLFVDAIEEATGWDQHQFDKHCKASWDFASTYLHSSNLKQEYLQLFQ